MEALLDGMMIAPPYVCLALAYGLVYSMLGIMDLSVSARFTASAYGGWLATGLVGWYPALDPAVLGVGLVAAVIVSTACWLLLAPLTQENSLAALIGSLGLVYVLQAAYQLAFGSVPRVYATYPVESGVSILGVFGTPLQWAGVVYALFAVLVVATLLRTRGWGRRLQAVAADPDFASAVLGISQRRIALSTALIASAITAPAAILYAASHGVSPSTGVDIGLVAFVATIVAGRERPLGAAGVAVLLVALRSASIRWTIWELSGAIVFGGVAFWIAGWWCEAIAGRVAIGLAAGVAGFVMVRSVGEVAPTWLPAVVIPASFQDVVPYLLIVLGLMFRPAGLLSLRPERAV